MFFYLSTQKTVTTLFIYFFKFQGLSLYIKGVVKYGTVDQDLGNVMMLETAVRTAVFSWRRHCAWATAAAPTVRVSQQTAPLLLFTSLSQTTVVVKFYKLFNGVALRMK